jgi:hypothetical protein
MVREVVALWRRAREPRPATPRSFSILRGSRMGNVSAAWISRQTGLSSRTVNVILNVSALSALTTTTPVRRFRGPTGSMLAAQTIKVMTDTGAAINFTAAADQPARQSWLTVTPSGTTPGTITMSSATNVAPGDYVGYVILTSYFARNTLIVPVNLDLGDAGDLDATPGGLLLTGSTLTQNIEITSSGAGAFKWNAMAETTTAANWLSVSPASGSGNGGVTATAKAASLGTGVDQGQVVISASGTTNQSLIVPVTLVVAGGMNGALVATEPATTHSLLNGERSSSGFCGAPQKKPAFVRGRTGTPARGLPAIFDP